MALHVALLQAVADADGRPLDLSILVAGLNVLCAAEVTSDPHGEAMVRHVVRGLAIVQLIDVSSGMATGQAMGVRLSVLAVVGTTAWWLDEGQRRKLVREERSWRQSILDAIRDLATVDTVPAGPSVVESAAQGIVASRQRDQRLSLSEQIGGRTERRRSEPGRMQSRHSAGLNMARTTSRVGRSTGAG
jgi:hypothetical protein